MSRAAEPIVIVGSGASAVHFALSVLRKGYRVEMLDVGRTDEEPVAAEQDAVQLKSHLADPVSYFLGTRFQGFQFPEAGGVYNWRWPWLSTAVRGQASSVVSGFTPQKIHAADGVAELNMRFDGFSPLASLARGGFAEAWSAGAFPFNADELRDFPFGQDELAPYYDQVAERIGISGTDDDLTRYTPAHRHLLPSLRLSNHAAHLLKKYGQRREHVQRKLRCFLGHSRAAALSADRNSRKACTDLGRCDLGCPNGAIYSPRMTLRECLACENFRYRPGWMVERFEGEINGRVQQVIACSLAYHRREAFPVGTLVLAAGTLGTARIFLESTRDGVSGSPRLTGLMDTRYALLPFVTPAMICQPPDELAYQFHQLALAIDDSDARQAVHAQITTLSGGPAHPIVQVLPFDTRTSLGLFRHLRSAIGCVSIALHDTRRQVNYLELQAAAGGTNSVVASYRPQSDEPARLRAAVRTVRRLLWMLGAVTVPGRVHVRPMGGGIHYAGTLPMSQSRQPQTVSPHCQSHDYENLFVIDGSVFPFLPSKGPTLTLMANAVRVADVAF